MVEEQEWMTAFWTRYKLYESLVMPFRSSNAPYCPQKSVSDTLRQFLDDLPTVYIKNILVNGDRLVEHQEHREHIRKVL